MKLEEIGFYTLSDERIKNVSTTSPIQRAEILITGRCNFKCPQCRDPNREPKLIRKRNKEQFRQELQLEFDWL